MSSAGQQVVRDEGILASRAAYLHAETAPEYPQASYNRARYYDSSAGRLLNEDPSRFGAGLNFYEYVLNDPVDNTDPTGLKTSVCCRRLRYVVGYLGLKHCYIKITADDGSTHRYGLHREDANGHLYPGGPKAVPDDPTDVGGTCKDVKDATPCKEKALEKGFNDPNCPSCGAHYFFLFNNSNYWAADTIRKFGMTPPPFLN
jgi:RHS repeat-associated protein